MWFEPLPPGEQWRRAGLGELSIAVRWRSEDLLLAVARNRVNEDPLEPFTTGEPDEDWDIVRIALPAGAQPLAIEPRLLDGLVVSKPTTPLVVPAGASVRAYCSTPVEVVFKLGGREIRAMPAVQLSRSWFGPDTTTGELGYAARTTARMDLSEVTRRPHRALTRVHLINRSSSPLSAARLKLPLPQLALYEDAEGHLWTSELSIALTDSEQGLEVKVDERPQETVSGGRRIADPRTHQARLVRALEKLWL